jgi:hypothetical protein
MFFDRRRKLRELAEAEADGRSFWTTSFSPEVRTKIIFALSEAVAISPSYAGTISDRAAYLIRMDQGWPALKLSAHEITNNFLQFISKADEEYLPSVVEAIHLAGCQINESEQSRYSHPFSPDKYTGEVNRALREHRVSFELIDGVMVPFQSREMHVEVVEPVLRLLRNGKQWDKSESAYRDALRELAEGHPDDAITDAARALQETLLALGCDGNALGPLLASARKKGMLGSHDAVMTDALAKIIDWVNADRTAMGDAHVATKANDQDAWFSVHVIGALILRLTGGVRTI